MDEFGTRWRNTTHDWAETVDPEHLAEIRHRPGEFAPGGVLHLITEVLAYAADEAECTGSGHCVVTLHTDGSVTVSDDGRGTDTRHDGNGTPIKKAVMSTKDLRFFDSAAAQILPDGHPRRGMSVVAALSTWLVHTNRRRNGSWTQRYEHGLPVTGLIPIEEGISTGTAVRFLPHAAMRVPASATAAALTRLAHPPSLTSDVVVER
ncbi:ATP-binding protein [Saccharopolyspora sp. CA-218241]|uniref:ATP-binding protein n=1 Tax=Saccharopolyspora sp. CA-218241 TaxID=3240027 RepID=UPI003D95A97A